MLDETDIQKLLRLKRYEQPPVGYHERFLQEFQRRQRSEMLRQPLWRIALERLGAFFSEHSMGRAAYGAATAAVLLFAGVASYQMLSTSGDLPVAGTLAVQPSATSPKAPATDSSNTQPQELASNGTPSDSLKQQAVPETSPAQYPLPLRGPINIGLPAPVLPQLEAAQDGSPHYILESRPVSYDRPVSF